MSPSAEPIVNRRVRVVCDRYAMPAGHPTTGQRIILSKTDGLGAFEVDGDTIGSATTCSIWFWTGSRFALADVLGADHFSSDWEGLVLKCDPRPYTVSLKIQDSAGDPIEGATVTMLAGSESTPIPGELAFPTASDGTVLIPLEYGAWFADISARGYATVRMCPYQFYADDWKRRGPVPVTLRRSVELTIQIAEDADPDQASLVIVPTGLTNIINTWHFPTVPGNRHVLAVPSDGEVLLSNLQGNPTEANEAERLTLQDDEPAQMKLRTNQPIEIRWAAGKRR